MNHLKLNRYMNDRVQPLEIQKYVNLSRKQGIISLAAGLPDESVLPIHQLKIAYSQLMEENPFSFQYQAPIVDLKEKIQDIMFSYKGLKCDCEEILITNGAQQAIYLTSQLFLKQNSSLMIDEFVYPGFLQIANMFNLQYNPIPYQFKQGMDLDRLEYYLKSKNSLPYLYIVSNGHNPYGLTLSPQTRKHLAYLAEKYNFILIEDDPYGLLNYSNNEYLPLRTYTQNAIYIGSFSKIVAPIIRIGWIVADKAIIQKCHQLKDMNDLYASNSNHLVLNKLLESTPLEDILKPQKKLYQEKLNTMVNSIKKYMKIPFRFAMPEHGMFIWLELLENDVEPHFNHIYETSKVLYVPANAFSTSKFSSKSSSAMRLNFTYPSFEQIEVGINNLSQALMALEVYYE